MRRVVRRLSAYGAGCWVASQVELQGRYTVQHVQDFHEYHRTTGWLRVFTVCLLTPLPCILCVTLIDLIPLEPTTFSALESPKLWIRTYLSTVVMTLSTLEHFNQHIEGMHLSWLTMSTLALVISAITIALTIAVALVVGYPIPFGLVVCTMPWFITVMATLAWLKRDLIRSDRQFVWSTLRYLVVCCCQIAITLLYPLYNYVFVRLSSIEQTAFVLLLPVLKISAKNWIARALPSWDDGKPEAVVFNVEIFHALYVAFCMQGATSTRTVFMLIGIDFVQACLSFYDVHSVLKELDPIAVKLDHARQRTASISSKSRQSLVQLLALATCVVNVEPQLAKQLRPRQPSLMNRIVAFTHRSLASSRRVAPTVALIAPLASFNQDMGPTSGVAAMKPPAALPSDLGALNSAERRKLVHDTQTLLYITEFVVLVEYVEVIMPVIYNILIVVLYHQPNHDSYPFLKGLTLAHFWPTLNNVFLYASLEFLSLLALTLVLWWRLKLSLLHQLAFVLERRQRSVQSKLVVWVIYVMQCSIDHFGADYSFRFAWLNKS